MGRRPGTGRKISEKKMTVDFQQLKACLQPMADLIPGKVQKTPGEWAAPCPWCQGDDRFILWTAEDSGYGRFLCRKCEATGDLIDFHCRLEGLSKKELTLKYQPLWSHEKATGKPVISECNQQENPTKQIEKRKDEYLTADQIESAWKQIDDEFVRNDFKYLKYFLYTKRKISFSLIRESFNAGIISLKWYPFDHQAETAVAICFLYHDADRKPCAIQYVDETKKGLTFDLKCKKFIPGSNASDAFFIVGRPLDQAEKVIIIESPIDALSVATIIPDACCISLSNTNGKKVKKIQKKLKGKTVICAFDNDEGGQEAAQQVRKILPDAKSIEWAPEYPKGYDVNDILKAGRGHELMQMVENAKVISLKNMTVGPDQSIPTEDIIFAAYDKMKGCADLFLRLFKDKYIYDHASNRWHVWSGHYWMPEKINEPLKDVDAVMDLFKIARDVLFNERSKLEAKKTESNELALAECERKIKAVLDQLKALKTLYYRKQVVEFAAVGPGSLGTSGDEWDLKPWLLPCRNGVVDLKTGQLRPGHQSDMLKTFCPTDFNHQAICPQWETALLQIFDNDLELICFIQRLFGLSLIGEVIEHVFPILFGAGRNGKDTIIEALRHILGNMASPVRAEMLLDSGQKKNANAHNAELMALRGKRLVWASETNEGRKLDLSVVKERTGGGYLSGREPYGKREVSFKPSHTLCMMTNSKPRANADDYASWKRILLIPFSLSFVDNPKEPQERKRDKDLPKNLKSEAEGILAWLVRGCLDYQVEGLNPPDIVKNATKSYQKDEDIINQFYTDCCVIAHECWVTSNALYTAYHEWAGQNGLKPMSGVAFGRKVGRLFERNVRRLSQDSKTYKGYDGIGLLT
ncbi:MAG: hypothetical protein C4518_08635 [Desulfobacteraceae bacterium]|nr:MAG: hypothetical protein C4518_08635 [Desulfobacteraceae bacterium]